MVNAKPFSIRGPWVLLTYLFLMLQPYKSFLSLIIYTCLFIFREALRIHQQGEQLNTSVNPEENNRIQAYRVRRNLFGPVDHDLLQQDLQQFLRNSIELAGRKWNFDFVRDTPSVGMLEWEELGYHEVPAFYRSQLLDGDETLHCTVAEQRPCCAGMVLRERNGGIDKEKQEGKKRQKEIKEYFSVKKQVISRNPSTTKS